MSFLAEEVQVGTRGRAYLATLAERRVAVVGLAKSGIAAARLLAAAGADVRGTDAKAVASLGAAVAALAARRARTRLSRRWPRGGRGLVVPARDHRGLPAPRGGRAQRHTRSSRSAPHVRLIPRRQGAHLHEPDRAGLRGAQRRRRGRPRPPR